MRCPKCGYNSFDHNLSCPKCGKDLTANRRLLNLAIPAPGLIDFFHTAGERGVFPEPILAAAESDFAAEPQAFPAQPAQFQMADDADDITPIDEDDDIAPLAADDGDLDDIMPEGAPFQAANPGLAPQPLTPGLGPQAAPAPFAPQAPAPGPAPQAAAPEAMIEGEEIEIDLGDIQPVEISSEPEAPAAGTEAAMAQIKTALAATGDLATAPAEVAAIEVEGLEPPQMAAAPAAALSTEAEAVSDYVIDREFPAPEAEAVEGIVDVDIIPEPVDEFALEIEAEPMDQPQAAALSQPAPPAAPAPPSAPLAAPAAQAPLAAPEVVYQEAERTRPVPPPPEAGDDFSDLSGLAQDLDLEDLQ